VIATTPVDNDTVDGHLGMIINATFSEPMNSASINSGSFTVTGPGLTPVAGLVSYDIATRQASFVPASDLAMDTHFTATITALVTDTSGNHLASDYVWHFTTFRETTPPTVIATTPLEGDTVDGRLGVIIINATFSESMDSASINSGSFTVTGPDLTPVAGAASYNIATHRASFVPASDLAMDTRFTATITTGASDTAGNHLASDYIWHFTTFGETTRQL